MRSGWGVVLPPGIQAMIEPLSALYPADHTICGALQGALQSVPWVENIPQYTLYSFLKFALRLIPLQGNENTS